MLALSFPPPSPGYTIPAPPVTNASDVNIIANGVGLWIFYGLMVLTVIMVLIAGYRYATSSGEPERIGKANKTLIYAAIAALVGLVAYGLPTFVQSFFW